MGAATTPINTPEKSPAYVRYPVAAAVLLYAGTLVAIDAAGRLNPASDTAGLTVIGRAEADADNSAGGAGAISANAYRGVIKLANSGANPIAQANVLGPAWVEDNQTVGTSVGNNGILAGQILAIDDDGGIWIDTRAHAAATYALTSAQVATANGSDAGTTQALANALKAAFNLLQADVVALSKRLG